MVYHLVLSKLGYVIALSSKKTANTSTAVFTKNYLEGLGISVDEQEYQTVFHPFVNFRFVEADATIIAEENTEAVSITAKNIRKSQARIVITEGVQTTFGKQVRSYACGLEDQLNLIQALHLLNNGQKSVDLKCYVDGAKQFVAHNLQECNEVMTTVSLHILEQRKLLDRK